MEKLIFRNEVGDGYTYSGNDYIPFEYESKDKFVFDVLEKYINKEWTYYSVNNDFNTDTVEIIEGVSITKGELERIEHYIYTLEEWFLKNKVEIIK